METTNCYSLVKFTLCSYDLTNGEKTGAVTLLTMSERQYSKLLNIIGDVERSAPELTLTIPCFDQDWHMRQAGSVICFECNPSGYY